FGQRLHVAGAQIGGRTDFAYPDDFRKDDVEPDRARQAFEFGLPRLYVVMGGLAANLRADERRPRRLFLPIDIRLRAAAPGAFPVLKIAHISLSVAVAVLLLGIEQLDRRPGHDGGYGVLIDQLRLRVTAQQQAEI